MGCDIHLMAEIKHSKDNYWQTALNQPYLGRNYTLFALIAGVRGYFEESLEPKGFPNDASYATVAEYTLEIDRQIRSEDAKQMVEEGHSRYLSNYQIVHPDFHSATYLSLEELKEIIKIANNKIYEEILHESEEYGLETPEVENYLHPYRALIEYLNYYDNLKIDDGSYECRVVIWFDN